MASQGIVLIGSGPSLNKIDIARLAGKHTIAFNRSYIAWDEWGFNPTYYACFDPIALEDNAEEVNELIRSRFVARFFLNELARKFGIKPTARVGFVRLLKGASFIADTELIADLGNVGASSLQILAALGYRKIVMVGVDARYSVRLDGRDAGEGLVEPVSDPDHFTPGYSAGRRRAAEPDLDRLLGRWPETAEAVRKRGIELVNASPGTALDCVPVLEFEAALDWLEQES